MYEIGIIIYLLLFTVFAIYRLEWSIMFILATLPSYQIRFQILGIPFTLLEAMIFIVFFVWFFKATEFKNFLKGKYKIKDYFGNRKKRSGYPFGWEIIAVLIVSYIAVAIAEFNAGALGIWKAYFFEPALFFILILNVFKPLDEKNIWRIVSSLGISALLISIFAFYQKITGGFIFNELWAASATRRVTGVFPYPNALGLYLGPMIPLFVGFLLKDHRQQTTDHRLKRISFIFLIISLSIMAIYFAKSEGALVGIMVAFITMGLLASKKIRVATIVFLFFCFLGIGLYQPTRDMVARKITLRDLSGEIRKQQWRETWQMLGDGKVIFGSGLANYQNAILPYHQDGIFYNFENDPDFKRKIVIFDEKYKAEHWQPVEIYMYPHNIFLNFWVELGLIGMILFIWIIGKYFYIGLVATRHGASLVGAPRQSGAPNETRFIAPNENYATRDLIGARYESGRDESGRDKSRPYGEEYLILGLIGAMIVIVVHGLVDVPYFKNDLAVMFWVLIAMTGMIRLDEKNR